MFENAQPPSLPHKASEAHETASHEVAIPLRAIEWSDLSAKLSAARDLRQLLREDVRTKLGVDSGQDEIAFADAAARFFRANEEDQRAVNHKSLGPRKPSSGKQSPQPDLTDIKIPRAASVLKGNAQRAMREKSDD